jgi:four helix bundle protein
MKQFPAHERFELARQLRRASFSVPVNIVEGFAHRGGKTRLNFLKISQASLAEVGYCIHVSRRLGYITDALAREIDARVKKIAVPLAGLIRAARAQLAAKKRLRARSV